MGGFDIDSWGFEGNSDDWARDLEREVADGRGDDGWTDAGSSQRGEDTEPSDGNAVPACSAPQPERLPDDPRNDVEPTGIG